MKKYKYFGNLIEDKISPYSLAYFRKHARLQERQKGVYKLYIIEDKYAVAKCIGNVVTDYCIVGELESYRQVYTNSRDTSDTTRQALYHGACVLEGLGLGYKL